MKNEKLPKISIVMLNHNGLQYLKKTIPRILRLNYPDKEFIIVDNGSADGSINFIKKFKKIKLIENRKNLGYSKGKNIGVKNAGGTYILLLDNDILVKEKNYLKKIYEYYVKLNKVGILSLLLTEDQKTTIYYGGYLNRIFFQTKPRVLKELLKIKKEIKISWPNGGGMFFKKGTWNKIGGFDSTQPFYLDDFDVGIRLLNLGYTNYLYNKSALIHLGIRQNQSKEKWKQKHEYYLSGFLITYLKSAKLENFIILSLEKELEFFLKIIVNIIKKNLSVKDLWLFLKSNRNFLKKIPATMKSRKIIQKERIIKKDLFLKIKPPK